MLKSAWGCTPPLVEYIAIVQPASVQFGKCGSWEGLRSCIHRPRISLGWHIGDGTGPGRSVKGVLHDQLANSSLSYCRYAGIVLLKEKIVSNSPIICRTCGRTSST